MAVFVHVVNNSTMSIDTSHNLESVAAAIAEGRPADRETVRKARVRMDELREKIRKRIGVVDDVVPILRSLRDE